MLTSFQNGRINFDVFRIALVSSLDRNEQLIR